MEYEKLGQIKLYHRIDSMENLQSDNTKMEILKSWAFL